MSNYGCDEDKNTADSGSVGATSGALSGGIGGLLVGLGELTIPSLGSIIVAGEAISAIATTLAGAGIGVAAGGIIGGLVALVIPDNKVKIYRNRISNSSCLAIVNSSDDDINSIERIRWDNEFKEYDIYDDLDLDDFGRVIITPPTDFDSTTTRTETTGATTFANSDSDGLVVEQRDNINNRLLVQANSGG